MIGPYAQGTGKTTITFSYTPFAAEQFALTNHIDTRGPSGIIQSV